jgi:uncharacterized protein (UPF0261 family)
MGHRILIVGTYDTKDDELTYIAQVIRGQGGEVLTMDVSVLGNPKLPTNFSKHDVAAAAGSSIEAAIAAEDENVAMQMIWRLICARHCPWGCQNTSSQPSALVR